jgi:Ca2+-binding RTX toxin-like protein
MADLRFFVTKEGTLNKGGSGNDTVFTFTGVQSSDTIKGVDGNDLISFANQTDTQTVKSVMINSLSAGGNTAGVLNAIWGGGAYETDGTLANATFTAGQVQLSAGWDSTVRQVTASADVQALLATGIQTMNTTLIQGGLGNDSVYLGDQLGAFNSNSIKGGAGNDILGTFNSGAATTGELKQFSGGALKGGNGNDTIFVNVSATSANSFKINGGAGNDSVQFSGVIDVGTALVGGGAGNDTVTLNLDTAKSVTLNGGNGSDSIIYSAENISNKLLVNGGTDSGNDTIRLDLGVSSAATVDGGLGNDFITVSGGNADGGGSQFLGNGGNDTIFFESAGASNLSGSTIEGGAGNDSILLEGLRADSFKSALIKGGAGKDTITIHDHIAEGSAAADGVSIKGGAGADSITLSAVEDTAGASGTFVFTNYSESTLAETDTLTFNTAALSADSDAGFASARILVNVAAGLNTGVSAAGAAGTVSASGGYVVFSGFGDNSLTARVSAINAGYTTTGDFAVFTTNNTTRYLFVQGGTTDLVARLADADTLTAGADGAKLARSGNTLSFGT